MLVDTKAMEFPVSKRITIRTDEVTYQRIKDHANERDLDMSAVVSIAISDYFQQDAAITARLEALRRALDDHQAQTVKALDTQLHRLGELIAMLIGEQTQSPIRNSKPMTFADVEAEQKAIREHNRRNK